ncbi:MAG: glycoside hydrolase family 5 protein [Oscillospiraceae bacterium]|nr:glycoside hydrolase family 5 protein [Oscillospiraceae bacterium]
MRKLCIKAPAMLLALALTAALASCGSVPAATPPDASPGAGTETSATAPAPTDMPTDGPVPTDEPVPEPTPVPPPEVLMPFAEDMTAFDIAGDMGAGWNLGNTLDAGGSDRMPISPLSQETAWGNPVTSYEMIALLADTGFNTLRVPVTWQRHIGPAPDYTIGEAFLNRVQEVVDYGIDNGLYVIVNLHHETWHFPSSDNEEAPLMLAAVWRQIAGRFAGYSEKLIFEAMNEPRLTGTSFEWTGGTPEARSVINSWNYIFIRTVRATGFNNEKRFLMIPTHAASSDPNALSDFFVPRDKNVLVSIHAYTPYNLTLNTAIATNTFDPSEPRDTADIDALFQRLDDRFLSQGTAVVIGEMGCLNKQDNAAARAAWADYYTAQAAALGIPCIWWDNGIRASTGRSESFGIMNRLEAAWWYPEIAEAMLKNYR